jgi:hypothetical protein
MFCQRCGAALPNDGGRFCSYCGTPISPGQARLAESKSRGGRLRRTWQLTLVLFLVIVVIFAIFNAADRSSGPAPVVKGPDYDRPANSTAPISTHSNEEAAVSQQADSAKAMPVVEREFIRAVQQGRIAFRQAPNEMAQGGTRSWRRSAICRSLPQMSVSGWVGKIDKLSSNSDGKGVLEISLADSIRLETWNNDFSDTSDHTLIDPSSQLFATASQMKQGDRVLFSGTFFPSEVDCVEEHSMSLEGSMTDPEFIFRFTTVHP